MKHFGALFLITLVLSLLSAFSYAYAPYGRLLCKTPGYTCQKIKRHQSWESLYPDADQRMMVMQINRMNTPLYVGITIAVPENLDSAKLIDYSPFPAQIKAPGQKVIYVDPTVLAWGAYDDLGHLVRWGPASLGSNYCPDLGHRCHSPIGSFHVSEKGGYDCKSTKFPLPRGGAPMPYCMYFYRGFALHGEPGGLPGDNVSHGCVRLFVSDAKWLNKEFVDIGTAVIVEPYGNFSHPQSSTLENETSSEASTDKTSPT